MSQKASGERKLASALTLSKGRILVVREETRRPGSRPLSRRMFFCISSNNLQNQTVNGHVPATPDFQPKSPSGKEEMIRILHTKERPPSCKKTKRHNQMQYVNLDWMRHLTKKIFLIYKRRFGDNWGHVSMDWRLDDILE